MKTKNRFYLERIESTIIEDSYEQGELESTGCGLHVTIGKGFQSLDEMIKYLSQVYGLSEKKDDYQIDESNGLIETDKQVANHSEAQNGGWMEPTSQEIIDWKEGKGKLYNEHYTIAFHKIANE